MLGLIGAQPGPHALVPISNGPSLLALSKAESLAA